ncbi:MAG: hypothetical protein R3C32_04180 [Chloroflexota bacterium]
MDLGPRADSDLFHETVSSHVGMGIRDLYVFGTAGEGHAVDERRFDAVVQAFADATGRLGWSPWWASSACPR